MELQRGMNTRVGEWCGGSFTTMSNGGGSADAWEESGLQHKERRREATKKGRGCEPETEEIRAENKLRG